MKTLLVLLLDESGSMLPFVSETLKGVNGYVDEIAKSDFADKTRFSFFAFNGKGSRGIRRNVRVTEYKPVTNKEYVPNNLTPLYDSIANTVKWTEEFLLSKKSKWDVIFTIMTDGLENDSRRTTRNDVKRLIDEKTASGWKFVYLGANQDSWIAGSDIGISGVNTMNYSQDKTGDTFSRYASATIKNLGEPESLGSGFWGEDRDEIEKELTA